jgi:hypothetical protein
MTTTKHDLANDIRTSRDAIQSLRDEIRLKLHLAGMDAKDAWAALQPKLAEVEHAAEDVSDTTRHALRDVLARLRELRARIDSESSDRHGVLH